ncbi:hypothetical protein TREMEDRAFT_62538 [Tremella mesenterica DSM 1558]|uniref:uncharacterized protein n=1 Tax=Tremella mesenterica (strain ATCC 24925 / CBS 8224 / DSM 1558 / NBRC 9311 / NRRL Y-6157 / RJB 2259-6 / UBC 559-6) TaxID=578456 RepID=UPI0003F49F8B|nr:uncharacterized protein TREMEDRAFT_62538 [Tremella mesenterica DSM 1558]EIW69669.1 hypothetical protein TREMEDRAFT_62538 [Tremella mesenterica DSM 1558]
MLSRLLSIPLSIGALIATPSRLLLSTTTRAASVMALDPTQLNVFHAPLRPLTTEVDSTHPAGFARDGYCRGTPEDDGKHFIGAVVTQNFLDYSKRRGNDLTTPQPGFPGLKEGCKWCLCVERWKQALSAAGTHGRSVVPLVDLKATALDALQHVSMEELQRFEYQPKPTHPFSSGSNSKPPSDEI